jgi:hypothetical protein
MRGARFRPGEKAKRAAPEGRGLLRLPPSR